MDTTYAVCSACGDPQNNMIIDIDDDFAKVTKERICTSPNPVCVSNKQNLVKTIFREVPVEVMGNVLRIQTSKHLSKFAIAVVVFAIAAGIATWCAIGAGLAGAAGVAIGAGIAGVAFATCSACASCATCAATLARDADLDAAIPVSDTLKC